MFLEEAEEIV